MERIRCKELKNKIMSAEDAARIITDGSTVGMSGFTPAGYPKAIPAELARRADGGEKIQIDLITGASTGPELDGLLAEKGIIRRRYPYQTNNILRNSINSGVIKYNDLHLSNSSQYIKNGFLGKVEVAVIEAVTITENGGIVPSTSVGNSNVLVECADKVIVEINTSQPEELEGIHDIYNVPAPPNTEYIPIRSAFDMAGTPYIPCPPEKIAAIVFSDVPDNTNPVAPIDDISEKMAENLIGFLKSEVAAGRLPNNLLPLQSGVGSVANAVLGGLCKSEFKDLIFYSEVLQDSVLDLIECGKLKYASSTSLTISPERMKGFLNNFSEYKDKIVLRPQEISNSPEVIRRLGVISINTAIEADIYGNVNSTHIMGSKMMNGIGGSGDFARNAFISIFTTASTAVGGNISSIVPMVSHVDHSEHDDMVLVTEKGVADLRGLSPSERAVKIIENCAHEDYKEQLMDYHERSKKFSSSMHTPHILGEALSWHERFLKKGSMK